LPSYCGWSRIACPSNCGKCEKNEEDELECSECLEGYWKRTDGDTCQGDTCQGDTCQSNAS